MGLMKKLTSAIVASSLVFSLAGSAFAATTPAANEAAGNRMLALQILKGKYPNDALALNDHITRAELVTIIVRAFGKEADASLLTGAAAFPDSASHWASGNIAMAKNLVEKAGSDAIGMPDGSFAPQGEVTPAQAVAFLMKFMGVKRDAAKAWPYDYLDKAAEIGLITTADKDAVAADYNTAATRGLVFSLFDSAFYSYKFADGKTFYTKYVDPSAPVLKVDNAATATTTDSKVTITGTVSDASELYVGSAKVTPDATGKFSYEYNLDELKDYSIAVIAKDVAGNATEQDLTISRTTGEAVALAAPASIEVVAGQSVDVAAAVKDANGNAIKDITVSGTSDLGTYADGKFTAGTTAGMGELTLTAGELTAKVNVTVKAGALSKVEVTPGTVNLSLGGAQKFEVKGYDVNGNAVAAPAVTWTATGGVIDQAGNFAGTAAGTATITATAGTISGTATVSVFGAPAKLAGQNVPDLVANANDTYTLSVNVADANGNVVGNAANSVTFSVVGSGITLNDAASASVAAVNGVATVTVKAGSSVTSGVITVTANGLTGTNLTYKTVAQALTNVKLSADPGLLANDGASKATVTAKFYDQKGVEMAAPSGVNVKLTSSAKDIVSYNGGDTVTLTGSETTAWTAAFTASNNLGSASISGAVTAPSTLTGIAVEGTTVSTGLVSAPYKLSIDSVTEKKSGETQTVTVRVLDVNGNQVTNPGMLSSVTLSSTENSTTNTVNNVIGKYAFSRAVTKAGTWTYTAKATWNGVTLAEATQTASVAPAAADDFNVAFDADTLNANGAHSTTLKVTVTDGLNTVTAGNYDVTFEKVAGSQGATQAFTKTTVQSVNGEAAVTVTSGTLNGAVDTYKATIKLSSTLTVSKTVTVTSKIMGVPNAIGAISQAADSSTTVGKGLILQADILDGRSTQVTTDNGRAFTVTAKKKADDTVVGTYSGTVTNGVAKVTITDITKVESAGYYFVFTADGLTQADNKSTPIVLVADAVAGLKVTTDLANIGNDGATAAKVTVATVDQFGNAKAPASDLAVDVANSNTALGAVSGIANGKVTIPAADPDAAGPAKAGEAYITFAAGTGTGSTTFTATSGTLTSGSTTINVVFTSAANRLAVNSIDNLTAGTDLSFTVNVNDANGQRVTNAAVTTGNVKVYLGGAESATTIKSISLDRGQLTIALDKQYVNVAGSHTLKVTYGNLLEGTGSFTTVAGAASGLELSASPATLTADGSSITLVTVKLADAAHNAITGAAGTATVTLSSGNDFAMVYGSTLNLSNGTGTFLVQAKNLAGTAVAHVEFTYNDTTYTQNFNIRVNAGAVSSTLSTVTKLSDTSLQVVVRDASGNFVTGLAAVNASAFTLTEGTAASAFTVSAATETAPGVYTLTLNAGAATVGAHTLTVSVSGTAVTGTAAVTVAAPAPAPEAPAPEAPVGQ